MRKESCLRKYLELYAESLLVLLQGAYDEAVKAYARTLSIHEKAHGPHHPEVATDLSNLAVLTAHQVGGVSHVLLSALVWSKQIATNGSEHKLIFNKNGLSPAF